MAAHYTQTGVLRLDAGIKLKQIIIFQHRDQKSEELIVQMVKLRTLIRAHVRMENLRIPLDLIQIQTRAIMPERIWLDQAAHLKYHADIAECEAGYNDTALGKHLEQAFLLQTADGCKPRSMRQQLSGLHRRRRLVCFGRCGRAADRL